MKASSARPRRTAADTEAVRNRIIQHAQERFLACGFNTIPMDAIASELGMSKKTIYRLFPSKTALVESILAARMQEIGAGLERIINDETLGFTGRLRAMLVLIRERLGEVKQPFLYDLQRHAPDIFKRVETFRQQLIPSYFGRLLDEGIRGGMVRTDIDGRIIIQLILTSIQHIVNPENLTRLSMSPGQAFETILSVVFKGVMTPAGRAQYAKQQREKK